MILNTNTKAFPAFISENYLNRFAFGQSSDPLAASSGNEFVERVADMEPSSFWTSIGSTDAVQESISAGVWIEGSKLATPIDFFAIVNHNLKDFTVELLLDAAVVQTDVFAGVTDTTTIISKASTVVANRWRVLMDTTQTVDAEKTVGVIAVGATKFQSSLPFASFDQRARQNTKSAQMADGSLRFAHVYRADAGFLFDGWSVEFGAIPEAEYLADFRTKLLADPKPFMFYPHPGDQKDLLRQARVSPNSWSDPYESGTNRSPGRRISFQVDDVGAG